MGERKTFPVIHVTEEAHHLIRGLEQAVRCLHAAETREDINLLYTEVCYCRKWLYEYIELLEESCGVTGSKTTHRFV